MNIGKLTSVYLTPEEDAALRVYCDKHGCTPHSVIKAGLHWMLEEIRKEPTESKKEQEEKPSEARKSARAEFLKLLRETAKKE